MMTPFAIQLSTVQPITGNSTERLKYGRSSDFTRVFCEREMQTHSDRTPITDWNLSSESTSDILVRVNSRLDQNSISSCNPSFGCLTVSVLLDGSSETLHKSSRRSKLYGAETHRVVWISFIFWISFFSGVHATSFYQTFRNTVP
jgi:hypothetical protein